MRRAREWWVGVLVVAAFLAASSFDARAQSPLTPTVVVKPGNTAEVIPARIQNVSPAEFGRVWNKALNGDVDVTDDVPGAKVGTNTPLEGVKSKRVIPWSKVAGAAAKIAPVVATGLAVKELYDAFHCYWDTGPTCDEGQGETQTGSYCTNQLPGGVILCATTATALVTKHVDWINTTQSPTCLVEAGSVNDPPGGNTFSYYLVTRSVPCATSSPSYALTPGTKGTAMACPAFTDPLDPAYNIPAGTPPMPDGRCRTGRYSGVNPVDLGEKFAQYGDKGKADEIARGVVQGGYDLAPEAGPQTLSGPPTKSGGTSTTTTTSPQGTPQVTTTTTNHNITYNTTINHYSWTTITNVTKPDGTTETTEEKPEEPPLSECEVNPAALNCRDLDEPQAPDLPNEIRQVQWAPMAGWGADDGSCPAGPTVSVLGQPVTIDRSLVCSFMSGIRFAVIGIAGVIGALILVGGAKNE